MKKGVYIVYDKSADNTGTTGVIKKIQGQIAAFEAEGFLMKTVHMDIRKICGWKILYRFPFTNILPYWRWFDEFRECDFIYFRHPKYKNIAFIRLFKQIKRKNPKVKIIMEIPTYPYDKELLVEKKDFTLYLKDKIVRKASLNRYIDAIAVLTPDEEIFGVKTIRIRNGFDFSKLRVRKVREDDKEINLVMCALMQVAHGYERLITGLYEYFKYGGRRSIVLHFVGDGPELPYYKSQVRKYDLDSRVIFYGSKNWSEIEKIYDKCDLGVSALGLYKIGGERSDVLKVREYLAAGLPFLGAGYHDVSDYEELRQYILSFPNDPTPIDMEKVVMFYDKLYGKKNRDEIARMAERIRRMAESRLNMRTAMKNVVDVINAG